MARKRNKSQRPSKPIARIQEMRVSEYDITSEPIEIPSFKHLPAHVKEQINGLHTISQAQPRTAIPQLLTLIEQYPDVPMLYNYLSIAYSRSGDNEKAEQTIIENYQRNKDYLFARLNYAEIALNKGEYEKVAEILDHKFDLKLLYPQRKRFHVSEFAGFMGITGSYFLATGHRETAELVYGLLEQVAPDYPLTHRLRQKLYPNIVQSLLNKLKG